MKSIQQKCQLSDKELKSVLRGEAVSVDDVIDGAIDLSRIHDEVSDIAARVYDNLRVAFLVMLEKAS